MVEVWRRPCKHGRLFSHYVNTKVRPFERCEGGTNVKMRQVKTFEWARDTFEWTGDAGYPTHVWVEVDDDTSL